MAQSLDLAVKSAASPFQPEKLVLDENNRIPNNLSFDVGIDGELAKKAGGFVLLELIFEADMEKTGGVLFHQYAQQNYRSHRMY